MLKLCLSLEHLRGCNCAVYSKTRLNPCAATVSATVNVSNCQPDGLPNCVSLYVHTVFGADLCESIQLKGSGTGCLKKRGC